MEVGTVYILHTVKFTEVRRKTCSTNQDDEPFVNPEEAIQLAVKFTVS